jgi:hypothetical protein
LLYWTDLDATQNKMAGMQYQFDVVLAAKESSSTLASLIMAVSKLRPVFDQEDVDMLSAGALERFGGWLMVDGSRLLDGEKMLRNVGPPKLWGSG